MPEFATPCWFLSGPTAAGKTAVGVALAQQIGGEIISMDSMAVYRGMDIGTAKPTAAEQASIPHHLIDIVDPHQDFSVAQYLDAAGVAVDGILRKDLQPVFVGGTPLYLRSLLRGIFDGPPADWQLRSQLEREASEFGPERLHQQLAEVDPAAATRLHPRDKRRLIRALEVHRITGRPISHWQQQFDRGRPASECRVFVLNWERHQLYERTNRRVDGMFAAGLVDEVRALVRGGPPLSRTAGQAVGYREVIEHLAGERDLPTTIQLVKTRTRQFAKRQMTWFRSLSECRFVNVLEPLRPDDVVRDILRASSAC